MTIEIELKYLLSSPDIDNSYVADKITAMLTARNIDFQYSEQHLANDYFDTEKLDLRQMDIGLRIRAQGDKYEQTIKTAGKVIAGVHQRLEYNVDIKSDGLDLTLFPDHIWSENINILALQQKLQVIFSTHFTRQAWLISQNDNVVELALDHGTISMGSMESSTGSGTVSSNQPLIIHELEIELVKGDQQALFELAEQLKTILVIEPSDLSKAARGYALRRESICE
ncbi:MAG: CYTH domain-containing protein [Colwellia sp.]|nr:CYTH domain-containing protein [Colwellia sp.]